MKLSNASHPYTTRSLRSIFTWAWKQARRELIQSQRDKAGYGGAHITVAVGKETALQSKTVVRVSPKAGGSMIARHALALWFWRAGMASPWRLVHGIDVSDAPRPALPAPRKPRPKPPPRNRAAADVDKWERKLVDKEQHVGKLEDELAGLETRKKLLKRRLKKAREDRRRIRNNVKAARTRAAEEPTTALDERDFATRMRAKRQAAGAAPTTR